ncbi:meiotic recombination protein REC114 isoform X4 [Ictalurus furcatus]|uniref:meiotic recombination protein REC114 isoform X4 n=1 Tax=Ictalurus furcatus TaxID=66913 RepID=UPI002350F6BC|nr:meiotic recombination protein REC114 isoform X4 [Ictalurus furcatus]
MEVKTLWTFSAKSQKCRGKLFMEESQLRHVHNNEVYESSESKGTLELTILESGHLLISQAQELLEGFSLLNAPSFLKIQQKSDSLLFYFTLKEESRMIRLQFEGSSRSEAVDLCRKAVEKLNEYLPVGTQEQPGPSSAVHTTGISNQQQQDRGKPVRGNPWQRCGDTLDRVPTHRGVQIAQTLTHYGKFGMPVSLQRRSLD